MNTSSQAKLPSIDSDAFAIFEMPNETGTPERNLLLAILERAVLDFVGNDPESIQDATDWILGDPECRAPFSFNWLCQQLDLDKHRIRGKILEMPKRGSRRVAPWYFKEAALS